MKPSTLGENRFSVPLVLLMETQHKLEIGARIRELRSRSPYTQANIADRLGITLRAYQRLEEVGTTRWERCEELGELHGVSPEYIWDGEEKKPPPDVLGQLNGSLDARLERIETRQLALQERQAEIQDGVIEILNHVDAGFALLDVSADDQSSDRAESPAVPRSASKGKSQTSR